MTLTQGFELLRDETVPELTIRALLYRHAKTGAELLSVIADDENKSFGITFRTPPRDSTGIAHILEHSVLCGSRKYPVKEPFVELLKSSLKTFLNAMTYPDKTTYPVASTNLRDFYNLVDVYLDAVFFPRITPEILQQEGWHYELERREDPLIYKGVVYNEMKGAYSSPDSVLYRYAQQSLFPDTTYGYSSGGDPKYIPDLTYDAFKEFHSTLYHPSNARIFFYGDDPPEERLRLLDAVLSQFERIDPPSQIDLQPRFEAPRSFEHTYPAPADATAKKGMVMLNWMIGEELDVAKVLTRNMLSYILLGTSAAPLRKALVDSGLGDDVIGGGYNDGLRQHTFSVGMKGIDPADAERIEALVMHTLESLANDGIDPAQIAAAFNTFEFSLRENNTGSFPRGLSLMLRTMSVWNYDGDPIAALRFAEPLAALRTAIDSGERVFEPLIRELLLANPHRTRVLLRPDPEQAERDAAAERDRLDAIRATLSDAELDAIIANTQALKAMQEAVDPPEELAKIPTLTLADIERTGKTIPTEQLEAGGAPLLYHALPTNGIVYLELAFDLFAAPLHLLPLVPLFGRALTEMGTAKEDFVRLVQRIGTDTGGISVAPITTSRHDDATPVGRFVVRSKATTAQAEKLFALLNDILLTAQLDNRERFRQIVQRARAGRESALAPSGNAYARRRLAARYHPSDWAEEQMGGISNLFYLRELERRIEADWPGVLADLEALRTALINRRSLISNLTLDSAAQSAFTSVLGSFIGGLPDAAYTPVVWPVDTRTGGEGLTIPASVNYVVKGANIHTLGIRPDGSASVATKLLNTSYIWDKVRVQGGAYGGGSGYDRSTGYYGFSSYRDPNLTGTLKIYDGAGAFLRSTPFDRVAIERAIIGTISDVDGYQLPDAKGWTAMIRHLTGVTDAYRQQIREEILAADTGSLHAFAAAADAVRDHGQITVIGSADAITAANKELDAPLEITSVL
jgi:Zn-dependent M16 (insulinase) family peptidase